MHLTRSLTLIFAMVLTYALIEGKPAHPSSSSNAREQIKYLLNIIGIENEYARFLSYMKIYPPHDNIAMRALYDELFSFNAYIDDAVQVYASYFTMDEVKELIRFYSSPLGRKTIHMTNELNKQMEDTMLTKISDYVFTSAEHGIDITLP